MAELQTLPVRSVVPLPIEQHPDGHGCLSCAEWRAEMRRRGWQPTPAKDWRGAVLSS